MSPCFIIEHKEKIGSRGKKSSKTRMSLVSCVVISKSGVVKNAKVSATLSLDTLVENMEAVTKSRGGGPIKLIGSYLKRGVFLFGWTNGKHSQINKHEFAPPYDTDLFFGDVVVLNTKDNDMKNISIQPFNVNHYNDLYEHLFGGFESVGSQDSEYDEDFENDDDGEKDDPDYRPGDEYGEEDDDDDSQAYSDGETKESDHESEWNFNDPDTDSY